MWEWGPVDGLAERVELKVIVPEDAGRSLGIDPNAGQVRKVYFLDTSRRTLGLQGVIVRVRSVDRRADDAVVKLRPMVPRSVPRWLRHSDGFAVEIDALPGRNVCSGALKIRLGRHEVARAVEAGQPLTGLLSGRQRRLLALYAPVRERDLQTFGPIEVRRHKLAIPRLDRPLTVEHWTYPDGTTLLEVSARCRVRDARLVARRLSAELRARDITPASSQRTKTEMALTTRGTAPASAYRD
ncbi:hypothetical protein HH310_10755 [Actinoplanes sp. TBRC 11911]|uniref:hypothetical protein n=1 Tax=Actinoplanes sp. TBRC 11911 TaxID=2729386 RepID=UPI00145E13F1|nr:hypothetical protein [Actinoplanes sp. TBRC 11911]NMO51668.1 hypothetical protein [Actinoplanes sp. TBRC 11911]